MTSSSGRLERTRLPAAFMAVAIALVTAILWLGWRLAQQDLELGQQRLHERRESAADLAVAELHRSLSEVEGHLDAIASSVPPDRHARAASFAATLPDDAVLVFLRPDEVEVLPERRLPFHPVLPSEPPLPELLFAEADSLEFRAQDLEKALVVLERTARDPNPRVRGAALLRIGRIYGKLERWDEALARYEQMCSLRGASIEELPLELLARDARLDIFRKAHRDEEARQEAGLLLAGLRDRRWRLARGAYSFYSEEALGRRDEQVSRDIALASSVESLYEELSSDETRAGRTIRWEQDRPTLVLRRPTGDNIVALVLGGKWLERLDIPFERPPASSGVAIGLTDPHGRHVVGRHDGGLPQSVRPASSTQLPYNVHAFTVDPEPVLTPLRARTRNTTAALGAVAVLVLAGAWLVSRALRRELAVSRLQSDFVSAVSHEFRTPLAALCLTSDLLASGRVASDADRAAYHGVLLRESQRLRRLVEDLLEFGRMEAGAMTYRFETVDPAELVAEVVGDFEREVAPSGYQVKLQAGDETPLVNADRTALGSAVWNLLDNAVKYSPAERTVWIDTGSDADRAAIRVRDRGLGIPAEEQKRVFEKFARGKAARDGGIRGTGVGLAMVRRIVAAHGGEIRLESEPGVGSTFTLLLPGVR
jgi:signal transduction histidine kinase/tetratricopeptide (TPR) repeat protein